MTTNDYTHHYDEALSALTALADMHPNQTRNPAITVATAQIHATLALAAATAASEESRTAGPEPAECPACRSTNRFVVKVPCSLDQFDQDQWHSAFASGRPVVRERGIS